ncbi:MAG: PEP-CTERM sorting domain-containing protein [Acidobacteriia bacterium]|nr:PEP-CTERM sorting domain-containing protein [Terriglobia bacterium]
MARADILASIPEYNGGFFDFSATYPLPLTNVGTFHFTIPSGENVLGADISGTFGNPDYSSNTALSDYFVDGQLIEVASCEDPGADCAQGMTPTPWSYTFSNGDLANLASAFASGSLDFNVIQKFPFVVDAGITTLDIQVTPEPSLFFLIAGGLAGVAALRRWKNSTNY